MDDPKDILARILADGAKAITPDASAVEIHLERPRNPEHGDFACNIALQLARTLKRKPREIAEQLRAATASAIAQSGLFDSLEIAGAGFLNVRLSAGAKLAIVKRVLAEGEDFGRSASGGERIQVEFVSANPTGPLHVGHGRQAALGDAIAALLETQGHAVTREFYYNDAGVQIRNLALSIQARARGLGPGEAGWPEDAYRGEYVQEIADTFLAAKGDADDLEAVRGFGVAALRREQDLDLQAFGVRFDVYYLESSLYTDGKVEAVVKALTARGKTYEQDGALWLRTTDYGPNPQWW